ncbi:J domain-containing protein [Clostridium sp. D33t1_170424_F3]|uniref:J domain-containing protein n=1 Tax=Clostridium sp. D33t1_170424_F3 TaxID=2787099 RepID=UPI0018AA40A9|nr:J domain-containing protein [Clostridium sp. D33t1_170424_F3]
MSDPYKILGVSPNATDEEVKNAYRALAKKYHPDNYSGSPIADLANEKMKEVNEAYDTVMAQRKNRTAGGYAQPGGYTSYASANSEFSDVRNLIMSGRIADAEQILDGVLMEGRNAEWYFLKGTVLYKRGWLEEAYNDFSKACQMDPDNAEYRAALNQAVNQRNGMFGGYNPHTRPYVGCSPCDVCSTLICADCCCDCLGGGCC